MIFTIEALEAKEGDCLLVHWGMADDLHTALIDGGPAGTYKDSLRPRLEELRQNNSPRTLELAMISHCDTDHIVGVRDLLREIHQEHAVGGDPDRAPAKIQRLWHNAFENIMGDSNATRYSAALKGLRSVASVDGEPTASLVRQLKKLAGDKRHATAPEAADLAHDVSLVLAGHGQSNEVRDLHKLLRTRGVIPRPINHPANARDGSPALITSALATAFSIRGLKIRVLGPRGQELASLKRNFDRYLQTNGLASLDVLAAYLDKSVTNLSSIICLLTYNDRTVLLTGDARGDHILDCLDKAKLNTDGQPFHVDVLKVPHHGSNRNVSPEFFEAITADFYVLSGNGKHGNPDRETLEWIVESRSASDNFTICLTYPAKDIDTTHKKELARDGKPWVPKQHSIVGWKKIVERDRRNCRIVNGGPVSIDLLDSIGE